MRLLRWLTRWAARPRPGAGLELILYTRRGCHLCEAAWEVLRGRQARWGFRLEAVDVDGDPDLAARHGPSVPVVTVNGRVRFRGSVNAVLLDRTLRAESRVAPAGNEGP